jgi:hypothetical protein
VYPETKKKKKTNVERTENPFCFLPLTPKLIPYREIFDLTSSSRNVPSGLVFLKTLGKKKSCQKEKNKRSLICLLGGRALLEGKIAGVPRKALQFLNSKVP